MSHRPDPGVALMEEVRDGRTQAVHTGHAVLLRPDGSVQQAWGDPKAGAYWRSSSKPLQAEPFVATGAFDAFGLNQEHLAVACASHSSEPRHVAAARFILDAAGLKESDLQCGLHEPIGPDSAVGPKPSGGWTAIHNNCSGKHAGMLAACVHNGWPTETYLDPENPLQRRIRALVAETTGEPVEWGTDGCSAPVFWSSIAGMARAFQRHHATPVGRRIFDAMAAEPFMVAGTGRFCTALMSGTKGRVVGKVGAAGLYVALDRRTGEAFAVKSSSGMRESGEQLAAHLADHAGWLDAPAREALGKFLAPRITSLRGKDLGTTRSLL